jgi:hypothetical protein
MSDTTVTFNTILGVARMAAVVELTDVDVLLAAGETWEAMGPIIHPTAYRNEAGKRRLVKQMLLAFRDFRLAIERIKDEEKAAKPQ